MSWKSLLTIYLVMVVFTLMFAVVFYFKGMSLILPFYGIELLALGYALYVSAWRSGIQEVVSIDKNTIIVEIGRKTPEIRHEFQRAWARMELERSWNSWYPSRLLLRSHGRIVEIGRSLNEQERQGLAFQLEKVLASNFEYKKRI